MLLGASWLCTSKAAAAPAQPEGDNDRPRGLRRMVTASAAGEDMDESSLLDLLESSVCLERLDTTAKVLRCQHTFCRCCLESIVCSRQELRCPECRALVGCGVEELPANILLVSLLDGIRQRPRAVPDSGLASELSGVGSSTAGSAPGLSGFSMEAGSLRELAASRSVPLAKSPSKLPYGKALYSYEGKETGDLKFNKGDVIILWRRVDNHWFHGELGGTHGFLPASYVQCLQPLPPALPQGKALYDFEMKDQDQDKDCLIFTKLNDSAKELMEMDKLCPAAVSGCHASLPSDPSTVASMAPRPTLSNTRAVSAFQQHEDSKKNAKKCHSFNKFSVIHRSSQATSHRHSMEIGAPVLISSSDPWAAAKIKDLTHLSCSAPAQDSSRARSNPVAEQHCMAPKAQLSFNMYLALYAYKPQKNDELELHKGEMYHVLEKCQDGWFKGTSVRSELSGVFPGNYMMPASRAPLEGSGPPWNKVVGGSPLAKGIATTIHPSGGSLSIPARAMRPVLPLSTAQVQHQAASPPVGSCLWHSAQPMESQAQNTTPTAAHSSALAQDQPTTTVVPLHTQNSPSCLSIASLRPHPVVLPQHLQQPPMQTITEAQCIRPTIPLMSATSAVTPPNVTAANLNGDTGAGTVSGPSTSSPTNMKCKPDEKKTEKLRLIDLPPPPPPLLATVAE